MNWMSKDSAPDPDSLAFTFPLVMIRSQPVVTHLIAVDKSVSTSLLSAISYLERHSEAPFDLHVVQKCVSSIAVVEQAARTPQTLTSAETSPTLAMI